MQIVDSCHKWFHMLHKFRLFHIFAEKHLKTTVKAHLFVHRINNVGTEPDKLAGLSD